MESTTGSGVGNRVVESETGVSSIVQGAAGIGEGGCVPLVQAGNAPCCRTEVESRTRLLSNGSSKKGPRVWAYSIAMPNGRCPFASSICARWCYAAAGKFPLNQHIYERNFEMSKAADFSDRLYETVVALSQMNLSRRIAICAHEKGEFYSIDYLRAWGKVMQETRTRISVCYFVYTRSWISPGFRAELDRIAGACPNARINLSLDREMVKRHGLPARVGDGLLCYLAETDGDLPPPGVDVTFRNLRVRRHGPMERLGDALVCPNESNTYRAVEGGKAVVKGGRTIRIRCQDCRLCIDRSVDGWARVKETYKGVHGEAVLTQSAV